MRDRAVRCEADLAQAKALASHQAEALAEATAAERVSASKLGEVERQVSYLSMDKEYLSAEVAKAHLRADRAEKAAEVAQERLR